MSKMNIEEMKQLLTDLAANIGYELPPAPFDVPFEEESIELLPDCKQFIWTVPTSVLNNKDHESFRRTCIESDIIDTVCTTSFPWPSDKKDRVAILLIDVTRRRRGSIKFVDASSFNVDDDVFMAVVCNMLVHDLYPGGDLLAFPVDGDTQDFWLDYPWNEQVCIYGARDIHSLHPSDYIHKLRCGKKGLCLLSEVFDIYDQLSSKVIAGLSKDAILLSTWGELSPQIIKPGQDMKIISMEDKMLLVPEDGYIVNYDFALQLLQKEEVLRQLPITRRITLNDLWRVVIDPSGLYTISEKEIQKYIEDLFHLEKFTKKFDK